MNHPVTHCVDFLHIGNYTHLGIRKHIKDELYCVGMVFHFTDTFIFILTGRFISDLGIFYTDAFTKTFRNDLVCVNVYKLILQR